MLEMIEDIIASAEAAVETNRKRHIVGGVLLSVSVLFAGLAITVITLAQEDD